MNTILKIPRPGLYSLVHGLILFLVMASFAVIKDKKIASLITSSLFLSGTIWVIWSELKTKNYLKRLSFYGAGVFLILCVLPIFSLRLIHWDKNFADIEFLSISGNDLHRFSTKIYVLMLFTFILDRFFLKRKKQS